MTCSYARSLVFFQVLLHGMMEEILDPDCSASEFTTVSLNQLHEINFCNLWCSVQKGSQYIYFTDCFEN